MFYAEYSMRADLSEQSEKEASEILPQLVRCLKPQFNLFKTFRDIKHYSDEIKFFHYGGLLSDTSKLSDGYNLESSVAGYSKNSREVALLKFIGEASERFSLNVYREKNSILSSYRKLQEKAININNIVSLSKKQLQNPNYLRFRYDQDSEFLWTRGISLKDGKKYYIPTQLIYLSYKYRPKEKIIYLPISTGAAGGTSLLSAISRGICEVVERDAFLITYLNKLKVPKVNLKSINNSEIDEWLELFERYRLELSVFDVTTEIDIPTFLTIVIDRSGIGSAVSAGLKTHLNPIEAILGSIAESQHPRCWIREIVEDHPGKIKKITPKKIKTIEERALYWFPINRIKDIEFLTNQENQELKSYSFSKDLSEKKYLEVILEKVFKQNMDVYFKEITFPKFKRLGYYVVKVIIPQTTPFYLNEEVPYFGGKRLYEVPKLIGLKLSIAKEENLNTIPHPFL